MTIARLKRGAIGPIGLAALAIGILSPALGLYVLWPPIQAQAGPIAPLVYLCAMLVALPTAISYAVLNAEAPSAGAGSTWLWRALSPAAGYLLGLTMVTYLLMSAVVQPLLFGLFAQDLLGFFGLPGGGRTVMAISIFAATAPVAWSTRRGAETSVRTTVILMMVESTIVVALTVTILIVRSPLPGGVNFGPFNPNNATGGILGFWGALVIGVLGFAGFDVVSTAAEEAQSPRRQIPVATLLTVLGVGAFWMLNAWAYTLAVPPALVQQFTSQGMTAVTPMARQYWGSGNLLIILTAMTGVTAVYISSVIATSRLMFALARSQLLPSSLGTIDPRFRVPSSAIRCVLGLVVIASAVTVGVFGNSVTGFLWWSNATVFFLLLTFAGVNVANILYFARVSPRKFRWGANGVLPMVGLLVNASLLYEAFFKTLWVADLSSGRSVILFCLGLLGLWILCVWGVGHWMPQRLAGEAPMEAEDKSICRTV
jgi:APA family basic amino acid/polyamine antiporter